MIFFGGFFPSGDLFRATPCIRVSHFYIYHKKCDTLYKGVAFFMINVKIFLLKWRNFAW